ncbi:MAG: M48 family metallopeptidase [Bacteroidota bacterium]
MEQNLQYTVHSKEKFYFSLKIIFSLIGYGVILWFLYGFFSVGNIATTAVGSVFACYVLLIIAALIFRLGIMIGYLKGNAVKVRDNQVPDIYEIVKNQSEKLGLRKIPDTYILQSGGILNAFATRFIGTNYIVLYSDILETAYDKDATAVEFIIGHELGHVKRNHLLKNLILFPSALIPFLGAAYSRACEYTCDSIGQSLSPAGLKNGLLILAAGKKLYAKVNTMEYCQQDLREDGFWTWFAEKVSSHPNLTKRLRVYKNVMVSEEPKRVNVPVDEAKSDHNKYMPV